MIVGRLSFTVVLYEVFGCAGCDCIDGSHGSYVKYK